MKFRSKKYTDAAKGQTCTLGIPGVCSGNTKTVCACHLNSRHKGVGNKSPDVLSVDACSECHDWLDYRNHRGVCEDQREWFILKALKETLVRRLTQGVLKI